MKAVIMGYHNMGCLGLHVLCKHKVEVSAVFTYRDSEEENVWFDSVADLSKSLNLKVYYANDFNNQQIKEVVEKINPDVLFSFYYRDIIPWEILKIPRLGAINMHGSLLPKYRGRCPVNWQLIDGEKISGVTLHYMVEKADAGDIIAQEKVEVSNTDTALTLYDKLEEAAEALLDRELENILSGKCNRLVQDESQATTYGGRNPEDGRIDWSQPAEKIYNLIRAVTKPYPGAFSFLGDKKVTIWQTEIASLPKADLKAYSNGHVVEFGGSFYIKTADGWLHVINSDSVLFVGAQLS